MSKRGRAAATGDYSSSSSSESEDEFLTGAALKKLMTPTLRRYPVIDHKSEET